MCEISGGYEEVAVSSCFLWDAQVSGVVRLSEQNVLDRKPKGNRSKNY